MDFKSALNCVKITLRMMNDFTFLSSIESISFSPHKVISVKPGYWKMLFAFIKNESKGKIPLGLMALKIKTLFIERFSECSSTKIKSFLLNTIKCSFYNFKNLFYYAYDYISNGKPNKKDMKKLRLSSYYEKKAKKAYLRWLKINTEFAPPPPESQELYQNIDQNIDQEEEIPFFKFEDEDSDNHPYDSNDNESIDSDYYHVDRVREREFGQQTNEPITTLSEARRRFREEEAAMQPAHVIENDYVANANYTTSLRGSLSVEHSTRPDRYDQNHRYSLQHSRPSGVHENPNPFIPDSIDATYVTTVREMVNAVEYVDVGNITHRHYDENRGRHVTDYYGQNIAPSDFVPGQSFD